MNGFEPQVLEATALPTDPQPLTQKLWIVTWWKFFPKNET